MARFFIHRPVFAMVLAIVTMLAGAFAVTRLAVSQYPDIAPTTVRVSATYSGATAEAVQNSVTTTLEDALTGIEGLIYTVSTSSEGSSSITLTFDESVGAIDAQNEVQTNIRQVESQLPTPVQTRGVRVTRSTSSILMVGALVSLDGKRSPVDLGDILTNTVEDAVRRTEGVGDINVFGSGYAMRVWLDPLALARYALTPNDVTSAVEAQNTTVSVGSLGDLPTVEGQQFTATMTAQSQLRTVADFENVLLKTDETGAAVTIGDVARVEIGQESYGSNSRFDGLPAAGFGVNLATGANAVDTAAAVRATLDRLSPALPSGVEFRIAHDTSPFVEASIEKVYETLVEAIVLVLLVILVFLQNWRATLIPIVAVPVVLLGTFAALWGLGYSINTLTMFAMVLAIGLLVDDAIVVVENVERLMRTERLPPLEATEKSMGQITGALVGIALVLSAVFLPMAFMGGSTGVIYRQFSATIITAMLLSVAVAIVLTPALCAMMLRPHAGEGFAPARWFNRGFDALTHGYVAVVRRILARPFWMLLLLALVCVGAWQLFARLSSSFLPTEDQGALMVQISLVEGATQAQTIAVVEDVERYFKTDEADAVVSTFAALGFGFAGSGQNTAILFVKLDDFAERTDPAEAAGAIALRANKHFAGYRGGQVIVLQPPAIPGLGNTSGFSMYLVDQSGSGFDALVEAARTLEAEAAGDSRVQSVRIDGIDTESALRIDIDQQKAESFGLSLSDLNAMLSIVFAGDEVNDFVLGSSLRPVIVQGDAPYRMQPEDVDEWYARNDLGEMVPFHAFVTTEWAPVSPRLSRYNGTAALSVSGDAGAGVSSGTAMDAMEELVSALPGGYGTAWTGISYQERQSGNQAPYLYALSVLVVFLCLAALYESWTVPLSVMLAVPVGVLGALAAALLFGQSNDVYFKVGILTTIGLAAKNAILIVEFAADLERQGRSLLDATVEAAHLRLRPILMTSIAFSLGVLPLAVATGAGAAAQNAIGIGVLGGVLTATFIGIFMVPAFYVVVPPYLPAPRRCHPERLVKPVAVLLLLATAACTVGPDYRSPTIGLAARFAEAGGAASDGDVALERWWTGFDDPTLNQLADRGLAQNLDILTAVERINQAEAGLRATGLAAQVTGDVAADSTRSKQQGVIDTGSSATAAADFVIDLFGGERRSRQQAEATLEATELDVGTARLAYLSSLVGAYVDARYYQEAAAITRGLIDSRRQTLDLVERQRSAGLATDLDVLQSQALLEETRATLPAFEQGYAASVFAIATLLATPADPILSGLSRGGAQPRPPRGAEAGVPADLLRNRPDVRAAERSYAAAVAGVGVAEADLYPSLDLAGTVTASNPSSWSFGPALVIPVLNQPLLRANRDAAISEAKQAGLAWRQSVLGAVEDVQTAQGAVIRGRRELAAQRSATDLYRRARDLSRETYEAGTTTFLDFLDAERSAGTTALALALSTRSLANDWTDLQIAAGRGWRTS